MGLRYRKSLKLAPGVRMNLSKSGFSWTLGPRGASVGVGRHGVYGNVGVPGTGFSARSKISDGVGRSAAASGMVDISATVGVRDDGTVYFNDSDGNPLSDRLVRIAKRQHGESIRSLIENKCDEINAQIEALGELHVFTPAPTQVPRYDEREFDEPHPAPLVLRRVGLWGKLFKSVRRKIDIENQTRQASHDEAKKEWEARRAAFLDKEKARRDLIERRIYDDPHAMESFLQEWLEDIVWPRETNVVFEIDGGGKTAFVDVDLPEIDDMPEQTASVPQRGYKLTVKKLSETRVRDLYVRHIHGIVFRIVGETFAALPSIKHVVVSGFSQRADPSTGIVQDEYLVSVRVDRGAWAGIAFDNLRAVDVVEALVRFEFRRDMTKSGILTAIKPFSSD